SASVETAPASAGSSPLRFNISQDTASLRDLPTFGNIDQVQLEEGGRMLTVRGWIAPPKNSGKHLDEILVALNLPTQAADFTSEARPDVLKAEHADYLDTGFIIRIRLASALREPPVKSSLCVAGLAQGEKIVHICL